MGQRVEGTEPFFYTIPEVAELARVSVTTVRRHARAGSLVVSRVGKQIRISKIELKRYLGEGQEVSHTKIESNRGEPVVVVAANQSVGLLDPDATR
jgi:excisionase family DNA binding protein